MRKNDLEGLKERVLCAIVLAKSDFAVDVKESTRRAVKYRRGAEIIIVIHAGRGWFDPLSDAKGDVFSLVEHIDRVEFLEAVDYVASLVGNSVAQIVWSRPQRERECDRSIIERWSARRKPWPGSASWRYLRDERRLPANTIRFAIRQGLLREGPHGSMWAAHIENGGDVIGWEERGPEWRGFSTAGSKALFRFGRAEALRLCVVEAAIDALSLAAIENAREDSLYLSTGGGWSPTTEQALRRLAQRPGAELVAATDNNAQGERFAARLREIAEGENCPWSRLLPPAEDWNDALSGSMKDDDRRNERRRERLPHARHPHKG
ncbi:MAG: DUF3991 and TOPRIM domain-containing protein [Hyphomicrobiales bacterium]|nr:DUF3991 and TOPRIM domain-containing protein [Hyphomicrobiales bacterium]HRY04204.1 DUF3991 and toprim domain-containing protein [Beijerinckiaceae bacterium]